MYASTVLSIYLLVVNFVSGFAWIVILIGLFSEYFQIFLIGIACISIGLIFQLITLPVEINASKRAKKELEKLKIINKNESEGVKKVLTAAAMTYIASVLSSVLEIMRLFLMFSNNRRD